MHNSNWKMLVESQRHMHPIVAARAPRVPHEAMAGPPPDAPKPNMVIEQFLPLSRYTIFFDRWASKSTTTATAIQAFKFF